MHPIKVSAALILAVLVTVMLAGCFYMDLGSNAVVGNGEMETLEIELGSTVTGLSNETSIDVIIDPELTGKAVLDAESNLIDLVEVTQGSDGVVTVDTEPGVSFTIRKPMTLRIPAMAGGLIQIEGSGDVMLADGTLSGEAFDLRVAGSGDIRLALEAQALSLSIEGSGDMDLNAAVDALNARINGSGDITISGGASELDINVSGSGSFNGFDFAVQDARANINGSGTAKVFVTGELTGSVGGSGDIIYDGDPQDVDVSDNASGDVRPR